MLSRRGFLARVIAAPIVALTVLRAPLDWAPVGGWPELPAAPTGISIRFIRDFAVDIHQPVSRFDILYGVATLSPQLACHVQNVPWWKRWLS